MDDDGTLYFSTSTGRLGALYSDGTFMSEEVVNGIYKEITSTFRGGISHLYWGSDNRLYVAGGIGLCISKRPLR